MDLDFFFNPNLAYLLLVAGALVAIMALIAPGTGALEVTLFFIVIIVGWMMFNIPTNEWALVILLLGVIPFMLAVRRSRRGAYRRRIFLGITLTSFAIGTVFMFPAEHWWQPAVNPLLAIVVSVLAGGYLWIIATKGLEVKEATPTHDLESLLGMTGEAKSDIHTDGSVQVNGELWSARSQAPIPAGTAIKVTDREGFILLVEALEQSK